MRVLIALCAFVFLTVSTLSLAHAWDPGEEIFDYVATYTVNDVVRGSIAVSIGGGFFITPKHVIDSVIDIEGIGLLTHDGQKGTITDVYTLVDGVDAALIKIKFDRPLPAVPISCGTPKLFDDFIMVGSLPWMHFVAIKTHVIGFQPDHDDGASSWFVTPSALGTSGSALFNKNGELEAIVIAVRMFPLALPMMRGLYASQYSGIAVGLHIEQVCSAIADILLKELKLK